MTEKSTIKFLRIREVKAPSRAYEFDAGIDFYVPEFTSKFIKDLKEKNPLLWPIQKDEDKVTNQHFGLQFPVKILFDEQEGLNYFTLYPGTRINIPSGIKCRMEKPGRALIAFNKSGIATKYGLVAGACVVDYLYQGEIHLSLINTSFEHINIYEGMKILQFVETPVFNSNIEIVDRDPLSAENPDMKFYKGMQTDRGEAGFDSTQKK